MHWNKDEIYKNYDYLQKLYNQANKPLIKTQIWNDLCTMSVIKTQYEPNSKIDESLVKIEERQNNHLSILKENFGDLIIQLNEYSQVRFGNKRPKNVDIVDYNQLLLDFFNNYQPNLIDVYNNLVKNQKIELSVSKSLEEKEPAACFYNVTLNDLYIYARFNDKIFSSQYLPHEMGHAYQAFMFPSMMEVSKKRYSLFIEVYSTYVELLFINYLKNIGYEKQATFLEKKYWQIFATTSECHLNFLFNEDMFLNGVMLQYIISMLLSNVFYEDYLKTNNHDMINTFNKEYLNATDSEIFNEYGFKRLLQSPGNAYKRILEKQH